MSNGLEEIPINIAANSLEMQLTARVITDINGKPQTIFLTAAHGVEMKFPGEAYPFIKNGHTVLGVITMLQVSKQEADGKPRLLIPGA